MKPSLSQSSPDKESFPSLRLLALPLAGAALLTAVLANDIGSDWIFNHTFHVFAAATIALTLLLRIVVQECPEVLRLQAAWLMVATSVGSFICAAAWITHDVVWTELDTTRASLYATLGSAAGLFAHLRTLQVLRWCATHSMAVCIALIIGLCPIILHSFQAFVWQWTAGTTVGIVSSLLWMCGIRLTSEFKEEHSAMVLDDVGDFIETIRSTNFQINISQQCSGLEGEVLVCFLISLFFLYDWNLFGRIKDLKVVYILTLPIVLILNAVRIASIFIYAEWTQTHKGDSIAISITTDIFHSNAGLVLYMAVLGVIVPLLYRWARSKTAVTQLVQDCDGPTSQRAE